MKTKEELLNINPLVFAFIGDAVHTLFVRHSSFGEGTILVKNLHKKGSELCCAKKQAATLDKLIPSLTEEELDLVRRTRNTKTSNSAKGATDEEYKKSTCFEALIGWHYLQKNIQRVDFLLQSSVN